MDKCEILNKKIIKVMGDYSSSGLWGGKYGGMIDANSLSIPISLIKRIQDWASNWDVIFTTQMMKDGWDTVPFQIHRKRSLLFYRSKNYRNLQKEQFIIAKLLSKYLGDEYVIYIFDDIKLFNNQTYLYKATSI